jgi:glycosyltransferase involved in cell wall biosynthesis
MPIRTVVVCEAQVPFVRGGAEALVRELVKQLRARDYAVERVSLPFKWYPKDEILCHAAAWRLLDLSSSNGRPIDALIATKFPTYFVRHPAKVTWLIHQYRAAYELCGTEYSDFGHNENDVGLRDRLITMDREMLGESRRLFTISRLTSARLEKYNGLASEALYHPSRLFDRLRAGPSGQYVLSVGRVESIKRVDLAIRAMRNVDPGLRLVVVGEGTQLDAAKRLTEEIELVDRVEFRGSVGDEELVQLYAGALATIYVPYEEDYGYVTLESFMARKPVITTRDAGGPLEFVENGTNGIVCDPAPESLADAINSLAADRTRAASLGEAGYDRARTVTWDGVIEKLLGHL